MQPTENTLPETIRAQSAFLINNQLTASIELHSHIKQAQWNVRGPSYFGIQSQLARAADVVSEYCGALPERSGALGGSTTGTAKLVAARSFLPDYTVTIAGENDHALAVSHSLVAFGHSTRDSIAKPASIGDAVTADFLTTITAGAYRRLSPLEYLLVRPPLPATTDEIQSVRSTRSVPSS